MIRAISYGGGVQSTALLVLAAHGEIDFPIALFCNVGDDSEHPATLRYVREHAAPFAQAHGIELVVLHKQRRGGGTETLLQRLYRRERSIDIPVRMANGAPGNRTCTADFKIKVIAADLKRRGATPADPAAVALGISLDEFQRMRESRIPIQRNTYPLIDRRLDRQDCMNVITRAGLPVPPKSSCWFCPFHSTAQWRRLRTESPDLFVQAADLEAMLNERRGVLGKDAVYLTGSGEPLSSAIAEDGQLSLFDDEATCDIGGYCMV